MGVRVPGPDPTDDLHATPFGFLKRWLGWTSEIDWAAQLNNALTTPQAILAATKTVPGILRLATAAEALAGTNDTAALTALVAMGASEARRYTSLSALGAATSRDGQLAVLPALALGGGFLGPSVWQGNSAGTWAPALPLQVSNSGALSALVTAILTTTGLTAVNRVTKALLSVDGRVDEYVWIGVTTGFYLWDGYLTPVLQSSTTAATDQPASIVHVRGEWVDIEAFLVAPSGGLAVGQSVLQLDTTLAKPTGDGFMNGGYANGSSWSPMVCYVSQATKLQTLTALPASAAFRPSGSYRRTVPTA